MPKNPPKAITANPWDRPPWPKEGDADQGDLFRALGTALSRWEEYESYLASIFSYLVALKDWPAARRSYHSVASFQARAKMLRAAAEAYFAEYPNEKLLEAYEVVSKDAVHYSDRRNDMAHGTIGAFERRPLKEARPRGQNPQTYALYPSLASYKGRDIKGIAEYCYTSAEINYFSGQFDGICQQHAWDLIQLFSQKYGPPS